MLPNAQLLAAQPQLPLVALLQSSDRYAARSEPSTPSLFARALTLSAPCVGVLRKSLHAYVTMPMRTSSAAPSTSLDLRSVFMVGPLEGGADADGDCPAGRIDPDVDVPELIPDVARRPGEGARRQ